MLTAFTLTFHLFAPKVLFGGERVVRLAAKTQVLKLVLASESERVQVVNLEVVRFAAAHAALVHERAASPVALVDGAAKLRQNISTALARPALACGFRLCRLTVRFESTFRAEALFLERLSEQPHRSYVVVNCIR